MDTNDVRTAVVEMGTMPRAWGERGDMVMHIDDGMVTILSPGDNPLLQRGMCFIVRRATMRAKDIDLKAARFCGSGSHHKFLVVAHGVSLGQNNNGGVTI